MDCTTARDLGSKVPAQAQKAVQTFVEHIHDRPHRNAQFGNTRMNKLLLYGAMKDKMEKVDEHLRTMLRKVIWKQWKTPQKRAWGPRKLGIDNDLAKLTSYCGDRYEWVVRRTCVVRAISKEVLTRRA